MPTAEVLAIGSAAAIALSSVIVAIGLSRRPSHFNAVIMFAAAALIAWAAALAFGEQIPSGMALAFFALRGVLDPGIAALLIFQAFRQLGVSVTVPIIAAAPLVSTTLSVLLFGEKLTLPIAAGTVLIIAGVAVLTGKGKSRVMAKYLLFAVIGTIAIGLGAVATKQALNIQNLPLSGLAVLLTVAVAVHGLAILATGKAKELAGRPATAVPFALAGVIVSAGFIMSNLSIAKGQLNVVIPLVSVQPLFTVMLSHILLRKQERITAHILAGTAVIVAGVIVLTAM